jgi:hypothetical protein
LAERLNSSHGEGFGTTAMGAKPLLAHGAE